MPPSRPAITTTPSTTGYYTYLILHLQLAVLYCPWIPEVISATGYSYGCTALRLNTWSYICNWVFIWMYCLTPEYLKLYLQLGIHMDVLHYPWIPEVISATGYSYGCTEYLKLYLQLGIHMDVLHYPWIPEVISATGYSYGCTALPLNTWSYICNWVFICMYCTLTDGTIG